MSPREMQNNETPEAAGPLETLVRVAGKTGQVAAWVSGGAFIVVSLLVSAEVLMRKFFNVTLGGMDEITGYVLAVSVAWTFAYALTEQAHIRIDVLYNQLGARLRGLLDLVSLLSLAAFVGLMTFWAFKLFLSTLEFGSRSNSALQTPLWIPQVLWVGGLIFFSVTLLLLVLQTTGYILRGNLAGAARTVGIRSVDDEVKSEIDDSVEAHSGTTPPLQTKQG